MPLKHASSLFPLPRLHQTAHDLATGATTSLALTEACLARIMAPSGEGGRAITECFSATALATAEACDHLRAHGVVPSPLAGIPMTVKDLFDVAGSVTRAGSRVLDDRPAAPQDAPIVARLRAAGAVLVGKTNMTEFAYSGLGLNPHYGTPANPADPARIPGGSSAGAGVAPGYGFSHAAIGTDTGGSVRIPAAFCGLAGFKPTQARITRAGAVPLSTSLDTIGPLAPTIACCALLDQIMAGTVPHPLADLPLHGLRFAIPTGILLQDLDGTVEAAFHHSLDRLTAAGATVERVAFEGIAHLQTARRPGIIAGAEAYHWHRTLLTTKGDRYDPRVRARMLPGAGVSADEYLDALRVRAEAIARFNVETARFDAVLCPTVAVVAPRFDAVATDDDYQRMNLLVLRNTVIFNLLDRPAATVPCHRSGELPVGLMVVGDQMTDHRLLSVAQAVELALHPRHAS